MKRKDRSSQYRAGNLSNLACTQYRRSNVDPIGGRDGRGLDRIVAAHESSNLQLPRQRSRMLPFMDD